LRIRRLLAAIAAAAALSAAGAFAAGATISSASLASGSQSVARCDASPDWDYDFVKDGTTGEVEQVTVSGIDADCEDGELTVNVEPAGLEGSDTVTDCTTTCTATVDLDGSAVPGDVTSASAVIVGP
jgi:hypothetical protein